jgi:hypothetical protein
MKVLIRVLTISCGLFVLACNPPVQEQKPPAAAGTKPGKLIATTFNSGFSLAHDTYNGISAAGDGRIYYVLSSQSHETGGQMYRFDPATSEITHLGDLTAACGEVGLNTIVQGKSHVNFVEAGGKLYFATHIGYYSIIDGMEKMGIPPPGFKPYPGGHFLAYDIKTETTEDLGIAPNGEGILTMNMDTLRGLIYGITWPTGHLLRLDIAARVLTDLGPVTGEGENGVGRNFRVICRSIAIDPISGTAYLTNAEGDILQCRPGQNSVEVLVGEDMRKDYFGQFEPSSPGSMGYNWRQVVWSEADSCIYGVHGNSGYLFRFNPRIPLLELLDRVTSEPSRRSGMHDQFSYGYLGFTLGPDRETLYYLTGGPIYENGVRIRGKSSTAMGEAKGLENLHLITWHIPTGRYRDHGPVFYPDGQRPLYVNSIAIGGDAQVYTLARITENGHTRSDLIAIPGPF